MLKEITTYLIQKYDPKAILMHGSRVRGDYVLTSDYDLAVVTTEPEKVTPHAYKEYSLDVSGISITSQLIETSAKVPIWPLEVLFEDNDNLASKISQ